MPALTPVWELRSPDPAAIRGLVSELRLHPLLATLLAHRGVTDPRDAREFLDPRLSTLPDPSTMKGLQAAVDRIVRAMDAGERICVWGDYDVDGVTSASQLLLFFEAIGRPIDYFVPDRFKDGYGLAAERIPELRERGVDLLVTVDCGVSNAREVALARSLGMDVIVVDHHQVPPVLPDAVAVLDPIQEGCAFPEKRLAACGVTFVLLVALRARLRQDGYFVERPEPDLREWLDLAAIGTVADMVPLVGFNRVLVHHGLHQIGRSRRPGVASLCRVAGIEPTEVTAGRVGFHLGPRINAAGRVAHASAGVELLTTADAAAADRIALEVDRHNQERRGLQDEVFEAACRMAESHSDPDGRRAIVLAEVGWHPGVLGIVCSKLIERYHRPTILLALEDGEAKGSARSIGGFRLVEHLRALERLLTKYGGHDHAAGLSLPEPNVGEFARAFEDRAREALDEKHLRPRLLIDAEAPLGDLTWELVESIHALGPFGMGNPEPTLYAPSVLVRESRKVGKDKSHAKLTLDAGGWPIDAIAFGMAAGAPGPGDRVDVVYVPEVNEFQGRETLQLRIKAMRPAG